MQTDIDRQRRATSDDLWLRIALFTSLAAVMVFFAAMVAHGLLYSCFEYCESGRQNYLGLKIWLFLGGIGIAILAALTWIVYLVLRLGARGRVD